MIPPFDHSLAGTTALRLIEYAKQVLIPEGFIKGFMQHDITHQKAKAESSEVMLLGGNTCVPVLKWDNAVISKTPGPITKKIQQFFNLVY